MTSKGNNKFDSDYILDTQKSFPNAFEQKSCENCNHAVENKLIDFAGDSDSLYMGSSKSELMKTITGQLSDIQDISNCYCSPVSMLLAEMLTGISGMPRAYFTNSGAEAVKRAAETAEKYSRDKYGKGRSTIVVVKNLKGERSLSSVAVDGHEFFHRYDYEPHDGIRYTQANDVTALYDSLTKDVCAVIFEPIQTDASFITDEFSSALKTVCREKDIIIIANEAEIGIGRTGKVFAYESFKGFKPDIVCIARGLGGGLPIGAFLCNEKTSTAIGDENSFYSNGIPASFAGATKVLETVLSDGFLTKVSKNGEYLFERIRRLNSDGMLKVWGRGMIIGIETKFSAKETAEKASELGLLLHVPCDDVIIIRPPLNISKEELDVGIEILGKVIR